MYRPKIRENTTLLNSLRYKRPKKLLLRVRDSSIILELLARYFRHDRLKFPQNPRITELFYQLGANYMLAASGTAF